VIRYGDGLDPEMDATGKELGTILHRCFEVLGANPKLSGRLSDITGVELNDATTKNIVSSVIRFEDWFNQYFSVTSVSHELPVLAKNENDSVISGLIDLVIETPDGVWVIDHKSDYIQDPEADFSRYQPQLDVYAKSLSSAGKKVLGTGINWIRSGEVALIKF